jgi:hypothetical protein
LRAIVNSEKTLALEISFNERDGLLISTNLFHVGDGVGINWEVTHSSTILWRHICDGGSVHKTQLSASWTKELDEFTNNASLSKHVGAGEDEVSGSGV